MFSFKTFQGLVASLLILWSTHSLAWWNDAWPYRLPITVDTSATSGAGIAENHSEATVLVKLHSGNFEDFFMVKEDLSDLRFIGSDDSTPLKHHVEYFDVISQLAYIWVKIPEVQGGVSTGKLWMYYGNQESMANSDATASYDKNTGAIYHFSDAASIPQDATAYANHAISSNASIDTASIIASGVNMTNGGVVLLNDAPSTRVDTTAGMTVSFWAKSAGAQEDAWLLQRNDGAGNELLLGLRKNSLYARLVQNGTVVETSPVAVISAESWQHIALTLTADKLAIIVDGNEVRQSAMNLQNFSGPWSVGAGLQGEYAFLGSIDELRIDNVARSNDWLKLQVASQGAGGRLLTFLPGEQLGAGGGTSSSFFSVIFSSTEESGWTVIALLAVLSLMSWLVMITKAIFLRGVKKDNLHFMAQFRALGVDDPGLLDQDSRQGDASLIPAALFSGEAHFKHSPVYRVYHQAIEQIHSRLGKCVGAQQVATLNAGAIGSIKASMNSQMVQEIQRMNSQMVLLTIAISGGPFLGLFGTVLGVMITFASIAATGDVNIAAIAPGVAAALLTTIVGLIVAIPAMFAYNWLQTRIKENVAQMRVFSDEFLNRVAEYYSQ